MRKLKVVFLDYVLDLDKPGRSGLSDIVWDMAGELCDQGHEVHVVAPYAAQPGLDERVRVHQVGVPPTGYRWHGGHLWICKRLADVAARLEPDVIHAPEYISTGVFTLLYPNHSAQVVVSVPGNVFHRLAIPNGFQTTALGAAILKWAAVQTARSGATVIAISREMKRWWEWTGSPPEKTPFIPLGVDLKRFHCQPDARAKLGVPPEQQLLLYLGRFSREKGLLPLLEALASMKPELDPRRVRVVLVGRGPQRSELEARILQEGLQEIVEVKDWLPQDQLSTWYSAASAVLLPSYTEAQARIIGEAMACGTPVIGSRISGTEDHVQDGLNGFLFPKGDRPALAAILRRVVEDPALLSSMRPATTAYAREHLAWPRIVRRVIEEVYWPIASYL